MKCELLGEKLRANKASSFDTAEHQQVQEIKNKKV